MKFDFGRTYKTLNLIEIDRKALRSNVDYFRSLNPSAKICPVLKSNAYGHGLKLIGKFVDQEINPEFICVDSLYEAYELEKVGVKTKILIMGYTFPKNFKFRKIDFRIPIFDFETVKYLSKYQKRAKVHLKIDTGMNRLGFKEKDFQKLVKLLQNSNIEVEGIYSHLSDAENEGSTFTNKQVSKFKEAIKFFESYSFEFKWKHICSTAGAFSLGDKDFNLIRLGLGFYGISPFSSCSTLDLCLQRNLKPALRLITHICQIKEIDKGETVSYDRTFRAKKKMKIAILPLGYYDGLDRRLSNNGGVRVGDVYCPILGRVCMNLTAIDVTVVKIPHVGQEAVVYDNDPKSLNSIKKTADLIGTIPHEILVNLSETTRRIIV